MRDGPARPLHVQDGRTARRAPRRPRARRLGAQQSATSSSCTASRREKVTVTPHGVDPAFSPGAERSERPPASCCSSARCRRARIRWRLQPPPRPSACRSSSAGPEKEPDARAPSCAPAAPTCAAGSKGRARASSTARRSALDPAVALRGLRRAGARGDGERHAGRALRRRALREVAGDAGVYAEDGDFAAALRRALAERRALVARPGSSARRLFSWEETARRTADVYRQVLA